MQKNCPTALLGRAAFAAYEALPEAKPRRRDGSAIPSISITEGRRPPSAVGAQNERTSFRMSFVLAKHYNPDISNFRFAILKYCPTALLSRAAFAAYERFAGGKTSAEGWLCHPEHLNHRRAERALGPRSPKRKTRYKRVFLFGGASATNDEHKLWLAKSLSRPSSISSSRMSSITIGLSLPFRIRVKVSSNR